MNALKHNFLINSSLTLIENIFFFTEKAMVHYEKAADFFKGEESNSSANKCMLKVRNIFEKFNLRFLIVLIQKL